MFASMVSIPVEASRLEEAVRLWEEAAQQGLVNEPGWQTAYLLSDATQGKLIVVALWDSESDARNYESGGKLRQQFSDFLRHTGAQNMSREVYPVSVHITR